MIICRIATRIVSRLSQVKLAKESKITPAYLCELEKGAKINPSFSVLQKVAIAIGVSLTELLEAESNNKAI